MENKVCHDISFGFSAIFHIIVKVVLPVVIMGGAIPTIASEIGHFQSNESIPQLVKRLQDRYDDTSSSCAKGEAAYHCSGLIIRFISKNHPFTISKKQVDAGAASFSYARKDIIYSSGGGIQRVGIILKPEFESLQNKTKTACIYPLDAITGGNVRDSKRYQCSKEESLHTSNDYSSCYDLLGKPQDSDSSDVWVQKFIDKYSKFPRWEAQCSFSTKEAKQFYAAVLLNTPNTLTSVDFNELILTPWGDENTDIPYNTIDAIWYDTNSTDLKDAIETAQGVAEKLKKNGFTVYPVGIDFKKGKISSVGNDSDQ
jgi:hypothetical protein